MFGLKSIEVAPHLGIIPVPLEKATQPGPRVTEQSSMDELDGRCGALDVQKDSADLLQRDAARSGMYVGPMQSGWYPWSAPLSV